MVVRDTTEVRRQSLACMFTIDEATMVGTWSHTGMTQKVHQKMVEWMKADFKKK